MANRGDIMNSSAPAGLFDGMNARQQALIVEIEDHARQFALLTSSGNHIRASGLTPDRQIIELLEAWLLDEEQMQHLMSNPWDIFFLIGSARLLSLAEVIPARSDTNTTSKAIPKPAIHLPDVIRANWSALGMENERQADIFGLICRGALSQEKWDATIIPQVAYGPGAQVHPQLIAACLRLGLALILDLPVNLKRIQALLPRTARRNTSSFLKQFEVTTVGPHPHVQATILVQLNCQDAEVHRALKRYEASLQSMLHHLNRMIRPRFLYTGIRLEIQPADYEPIDFKFCVDTSSALQLFVGSTLYNDRRVFLRELIQNAVDACNLRKMYETGYEPFIQVAFNQDISRITIRDNGIGMSKQWIEKYFLNIGLSFYQSDEISRVNRDANIQFSFISQFGIGFLSSFLVARQVTIKTRRAGSPGFMITINRLDDYFDVRLTNEEIPVGTEVTIHLKENTRLYSRSLEYLGYLKTNVRFLPIKVIFVNEKGDTSILGQEPLPYDEDKGRNSIYTSDLEFRSSQGYLCMRVKQNHEYIYDLETARGGFSIFQDGIFITQVKDLLPESAGDYAIGRLNLVGEDKCELSMDRNRLLWDGEKKAGIKKRVLHGMVTIANRLLENASGQPIPENILRNLSLKLAGFFDFNDVDDMIYDRLHHHIQVRVANKFRLFVRSNRGQFDSLRYANNPGSNSHGYTHIWQQQIADSLRRKRKAVNA
jgi:hypothetical protein